MGRTEPPSASDASAIRDTRVVTPAIASRGYFRGATRSTPLLGVERIVAEERVVQRRFRRRAPDRVDKSMARGPDVSMLPGTDLVVHLQDVEVLLGAQIEHPQFAGGH